MPDHPRFARVHVSPSGGTHEWPLVERVAGGWQSGGHHYPDSIVLEVEPLHLVPDPLAEVRDGLPTLNEIRAALHALQVPVDESEIHLAEATPERQVTMLLAMLMAWTTVYQLVQDAEHDPLDADVLELMIGTVEHQVSGGDPAAAMNCAVWHLQWAGFIANQIGSSYLDDPLSPMSAIVHLIRSAGALFMSWQQAQRAVLKVITAEGAVYGHTGSREHVHNARTEAERALAAIGRLLGPAES